MKYEEQFVKRVVDAVIERRLTGRKAALMFKVCRATVARWVKRRLGRLPTWFSRATKIIANKTGQVLLNKLRRLLEQTKNAVASWIEIGKCLCLRTVFRWKKTWFPKPVKVKVKCKRYQRNKPFSLVHTDWATKRIAGGEKISISFYEDDCTRALYALKAYHCADFTNTADNFTQALEETGGFKAVLSDCGKVYNKQSFGIMTSSLGIKSIHTRPYHPQCNGKAEALVKKIKKFLNQYKVRSLSHANKLLAKYQKQYNNAPHSSLKYQTPKQILQQKTGNICDVS